MAITVDWPWKAGDDESITFVWPGTLGSETFACEIRTAQSAAASPGTADVTATCSAVQVSSNIELTVSVTDTNTRAVAVAGTTSLRYDVQQTSSGVVSTLFEGAITVSGDVTK